MNKIILSSVCAFALMSGMGHAEESLKDQKGWYIGVESAYSILGKEKAKGSTLDLQSHFNDGWAFGGNLGYDFGDFRLEAEIAKHLHSADRFTIANDGGLALGGTGNVAANQGKSRLTSYMMNLVYDFGDFGSDKSYEPFIGGGLGLADMKWNNLATSSATIVNDTDSVFAYQMFAGIRVPIATALEMSFKYRFIGTENATMQDRLGNRFEASYGAHDIMLGLTYRFGVKSNKAVAEMPKPIAVAVVEPEPEPEPVVEPVMPDPMPEPAAGPVIEKGPYVVYFDWDSSRITAVANEVIEKASTEARKSGEIIINVAGHADRSGTDAYNEKLSLSRAEVVKAALVSYGIAEDRITINSFGESQGEIETDDGVREGKNRRVVIILE